MLSLDYLLGWVCSIDLAKMQEEHVCAIVFTGIVCFHYYDCIHLQQEYIQIDGIYLFIII